jgi:diacylglycerol kinase (ATP)
MKKILLIVNPVSGKRDSKKILPNVILRLKNKYKVEIIESEFKGHIEKILYTYQIQNYHFCCIVGGDGSFHEAINGLMDRKDQVRIPLALLPTGSGNSLARDLGILNLKTAFQKIISNKISKLDIAQINYNNKTVYSFNIVGWGMVATVGVKAEKFRWLGTSRYTLLSLFEVIFKQTNKATIEYYDCNKKKYIINGNFMFAALCNTIHTGKGMKIAPKAKLNDGLIDLVLIKDASRFKLLKLMSKLFSGMHIYDKSVEYSKISKFKLNTDKKSVLNIDGEIKASAPFELKVIHNAIEIIN